MGAGISPPKRYPSPLPYGEGGVNTVTPTQPLTPIPQQPMISSSFQEPGPGQANQPAQSQQTPAQRFYNPNQQDSRYGYRGPRLNQY